MRPHTKDGDRYDLSVTIGGELVSTGGNLPAGITGERAVQLLMESTVDLVRAASAEVARQWRALEVAAKNDGAGDA